MSEKFTSAQHSGRGYHDIGGEDFGPIDPKTTDVKPWEKLSIAIGNSMGGQGRKVINTDMGRRAREEMGEKMYNSLDYFERTTESMKITMVEKGLFTEQELENRMNKIKSCFSELKSQ